MTVVGYAADAFVVTLVSVLICVTVVILCFSVELTVVVLL